MYYAVIDTNVLVSALLSADFYKSAPAKWLDICWKERLFLFTVRKFWQNIEMFSREQNFISLWIKYYCC